MKQRIIIIRDYLCILLPSFTYLSIYRISRVLIDIFNYFTRGRLQYYDSAMYNLLDAALAAITAVPILLYLKKHGIYPPKYTSGKKPDCFVEGLGTFLVVFAIFEVCELRLLEVLYKLFPNDLDADYLFSENRSSELHNQWLIFLLVAIIVPILEELYFRKLTACFAGKRIHNPCVLILIEALIFMAGHNYSAPGLFSCFISGIFYGMLYYYSGSLLYSILAHGLGNFSAYFLNSYIEQQVFIQVITLVGIILLLISWINKRFRKEVRVNEK